MVLRTHRAWRRHLLALRDKPGSPVAEAYRSLRTSLQFLSEERQGALVVTSWSKGDGKTTCVANLGVALATAGRRVLLVSADMRQPGLDRIFGPMHRPGLSRLLGGGGEQDGVQPTDVPGLDVLPCGPIPPNPAESLGMPVLDALLRGWQQAYGHVLFDAPPLLGVTDALLLARRVGRALLVVRAMRTTDRALATSSRLLREAGVDVLGCVLVGHRAPEDASAYGYGSIYEPAGGLALVPGPEAPLLAPGSGALPAIAPQVPESEPEDA